MNPDRLVREAATKEEALWTAVGMLSFLRRDPQFTHAASLERLRQEFDPGLLAQGDAGLAAVVALEMLRDHGDGRALDLLAKRPIADSDLAGVRSDIMVLLRRTKALRDGLAARGIHWFGLTPQALAGLGTNSVFAP